MAGREEEEDLQQIKQNPGDHWSMPEDKTSDQMEVSKARRTRAAHTGSAQTGEDLGC